MGPVIKVNGTITKKMEKECSHGQMDDTIKAIMKTTKRKALASSDGRMARDISEHGKITSNTALE